MKKVKVLLMVTLPLLLAFYVTVTNKMNTKRYQNEVLTLDNVESLSFDVGEWWERKDYSCVEVICQCITYRYYSTYAKYVGDGNGEVAHLWNCRGCGDCGFTDK